MYKGTNPTALQSQKWFKGSLFDLCLKKPYKRISIKELCAKADLSRQTFYMLFKSKEEVVELIIDDMFTDALSKMEISEMSIARLLGFCFGVFKEDMPGIKILIDNNLVWILRKKLQEHVFMLTPHVCKDDMTDEMQHYTAAFISGAIIDVIVYLNNNGAKKTQSELTEMVLYLLKGGYLKQDS